MNSVLAFRPADPAAPFEFAVSDQAGSDLNLFLGLTVFGVLPQVAAVAYYGVLLAGILIASALVGMGLGFAIRRFSSGPQMLELNGATRSRAISETLKKAA